MSILRPERTWTIASHVQLAGEHEVVYLVAKADDGSEIKIPLELSVHKPAACRQMELYVGQTKLCSLDFVRGVLFIRPVPQQ